MLDPYAGLGLQEPSSRMGYPSAWWRNPTSSTSLTDKVLGAAKPEEPPPPDQSLGRTALYLQVAAADQAILASFYGAKSDRSRLQTEALNSEYEGTIASLEAADAAYDAAEILRAAKQEIGRVSMRYGQERESTRADAAARGIVVDAGSAGDTTASIERARQEDVSTIEQNATSAAGAQRRRQVNAANQSMLAKVEADNARRAARVVSPTMRVIGTVLGAGGTIASSWAQNRRWERYSPRIN